VDGADDEVVPRLAIEADDDGVEAERLPAEAGRDARGDLGDIERVLGGLGLLGAQDREDELAVALGDRRGAVALVGQPVLGEDERGDRVRLRVDEDGGAERAAQGQRAGPGVERPQRGGAAAPQLLRRAVEDERERVGAEGECAADACQAAAEVGQQEVARRVAALGVEAAEVVDVEREQEQAAARVDVRDRGRERREQFRPRSEPGVQRRRAAGAVHGTGSITADIASGRSARTARALPARESGGRP
jgi:hypothetical protein